MNIEQHLFQISPDKIKLGLERTNELLSCCGNPEKSIFSIQIVGTNGKGSTAALLANIFNKKYKVGLFTSPHLIDYKERIRINFKKIETKEVKQFLLEYKDDFEKIKPSFFEIMTAMAMWHFQQKKVDVAILETGLGGRLDSVTACKNSVLAFTNIDLDHQKILGETIEEITKEKVAAINLDTKQIFITQQNKKIHMILNNEAKKFKLIPKIIDSKFSNINLKYLYGDHQIMNAELAKQIAENISKKYFNKIQLKDINIGLEQTRWPGRFQIISKKPTIIFDVAHNNAGIESFIQTLNIFLLTKTFTKKILICAFEDNKNIHQSFFQLSKYFDNIICTETRIKKSMDCKKIFKLFQNTPGQYNKNIEKVLCSTLSGSQNKDLICIIGTHYFGPYISKIYNKSFAKI
jgi:dihydrofolate synthase/folylpolyglutamate synthase